MRQRSARTHLPHEIRPGQHEWLWSTTRPRVCEKGVSQMAHAYPWLASICET